MVSKDRDTEIHYSQTGSPAHTNRKTCPHKHEVPPTQTGSLPPTQTGSPSSYRVDVEVGPLEADGDPVAHRDQGGLRGDELGALVRLQDQNQEQDQEENQDQEQNQEENQDQEQNQNQEENSQYSRSFKRRLFKTNKPTGPLVCISKRQFRNENERFNIKYSIYI